MPYKERVDLFTRRGLICLQGEGGICLPVRDNAICLQGAGGICLQGDPWDLFTSEVGRRPFVYKARWDLFTRRGGICLHIENMGICLHLIQSVGFVYKERGDLFTRTKLVTFRLHRRPVAILGALHLVFNVFIIFQ